MILKLSRHNQAKEIEFELRFLQSLSLKERFEMMFKKSKEMAGLLRKNGRRKPSEIIKRT
ncbi:MAG: hypothetical protein FJZ13_00210 [Candidatus Omnitrophica bacterium]|nr:hypothetical protein [Candidatus Omnitrophota bacterium]